MADICNGEENSPVYFENYVDSEPFPTIKYTPFNLAGPECEDDPCEVIYTGCMCQNKSCAEDCPCIARSLGPSYDESGRLLSSRYSRNKPILECNSLCKCSQSCSNRVVQNGIKFRLKVFQTEQKGWGLKALETIPPNRFLCEYAGEVIGFREACRRSCKMSQEDSNYILILKEHLQGGKVLKTCVDPSSTGNIGRYINHSCDPNLYMVAVRVDNEVPKLALFAKREILNEEELSFDYAGEIHETVRDQESGDVGVLKGQEKSSACTSKSDRTFYKPCFCRTSNCRGRLPFDRDLYSEIQNANTGLKSEPRV